MVTFFLIYKVKAQYSTSYISYEYTEIMAFSIEITYSSSSGFYQPYSPYISYGNALATMTERYEENHAIISKEWGKLMSLDLINLTNKSTLKQHQETISAAVKNNCKGDLGNQAYADEWIEYVTQTFKIQSIKYEILLLQSCQSELNRIKYKDPDNYIYSKRYKSIMKTLDLLKNCSPSEIKNLSWEKTELESTSNNNASNSNNEYIIVTNPNFTYKRSSKYIQIDAAPAPEIFKVVEQMPEFPGGEAALYKYLVDNLRYPERATNAGAQGTVRVKFVINEDGRISMVDVPRPIGNGMDEEAKRVVQSMPPWKPGKNNGKPVKVYFQIPIKFVLKF